jgi:hypothetical protein
MTTATPVDAIKSAVRSVTKDWAKVRKAEERKRSAASDRRYRLVRSSRTTIREAAFEVMDDAYLEASGGGTLPVKPRQIMYRARPYILKRTGEADLNRQYFSQTLLIGYMEEYDCADWDIIWDARGHLIEPHTGHEVALGTLEVRQYLGERPSFGAQHGFKLFPTVGPENRYRNILYIEKEGFHPILQAARLQERFDIALMSNKGMSVTASRMLIDQLADHYDKVFVLRDFDRAGFSIFGTLFTDSRRYIFENDISGKVVDLGLRLTDVVGLESEPVPQVDPREWDYRAGTLRRHGATTGEVELLRERRVELNAMTSLQLVDFVETKLTEHGVGKVVPDDDVIEKHARRVISECLIAKIGPRRSICRKICASRSHRSSKRSPNCRGTQRSLRSSLVGLRYDASNIIVIAAPDPSKDGEEDRRMSIKMDLLR